MTTGIVIICSTETQELALEMGLVYAMMQTSTYIWGLPVSDRDSPNHAFFRELGGQIHDTNLNTLLASHPNAQVIRL